MYNGLRKMENGKTFPDLGVLKKIWELVMTPTAAAAAGDGGDEEERQEMQHEEIVKHNKPKRWRTAGEETSDILIDVRYNAHTPEDLNTAQAVEIDKSDWGEGCLAVRIISKYERMGRLVFKKVWRRARRQTKHYAVGFERKRRRGQGTWTQRTWPWRAKRAGLSRILALRDL